MAPKKDDAAIFAENIKLFRQSFGISQKDLAEIMKVTQSNVSQWESGVCTPPVRVLQVIKHLYPKVNTDWFFTDPKPSKNFTENKFRSELSITKESNEKLKQDLVNYNKMMKKMEDEIERLREQNEVLTKVAKAKLTK